MGTQLPPRPHWDVREQFFGTLGVLETERKYYSWMNAQTKETKRVDSKREITIEAVEAFLTSIEEKKPFSMVRNAADSTLTAILGRMACEKRREVTWKEMLQNV